MYTGRDDGAVYSRPRVPPTILEVQYSDCVSQPNAGLPARAPLCRSTTATVTGGVRLARP
eukprot:1977979-Rhodomonas_salina.1